MDKPASPDMSGGCTIAMYFVIPPGVCPPPGARPPPGAHSLSPLVHNVQVEAYLSEQRLCQILL